ncbi:hypothetical protein HPP92_006823 [Vanilla planifolia]|uniref:Uncharacterized protein n=1 Tax=Vanilla planifolia TaxID=51239 RepID=A0A835RKL6_VANPL|nr:hypothetical protein HPP92_006823 [Vanilla planifolia]
MTHPSNGDPTNQLPCALGLAHPSTASTRETPWSVFPDGSNGSPPTIFHEQRAPGSAAAMARDVRPRAVAANHHSKFFIQTRHTAGPYLLPSRQFQALFDSLFKVLFIFPSRYLFAIGLSQLFSLGRNLPPNLGCIPKQPDSLTAPRVAAGYGPNGALTLPGAPFQGT